MAGKPLAENLESVPDLAEGQQVIMPMDKPIKETGHLQVRPCCPYFAQERPALGFCRTASHSDQHGSNGRERKKGHEQKAWGGAAPPMFNQSTQCKQHSCCSVLI